jgi:putative transposase
VCRYVEPDAVRASLVRRAEEWPWSSLWRREFDPGAAWLAPWPVERSPLWKEDVNMPQTAGELAAVREAIKRGLPFGDTVWQESVEGNDTPGIAATSSQPGCHTRPQSGGIRNT